MSFRAGWKSNLHLPLPPAGPVTLRGFAEMANFLGPRGKNPANKNKEVLTWQDL